MVQSLTTRSRPGPSGVKCEKCGTIILETYTDKDIEII